MNAAVIGGTKSCALFMNSYVPLSMNDVNAIPVSAMLIVKM